MRKFSHGVALGLVNRSEAGKEPQIRRPAAVNDLSLNRVFVLGTTTIRACTTER